MTHRSLIPLAAVALVCGGTVAVARAATSQAGDAAAPAVSCTADPSVADVGTAQQFTLTCTVPKPGAASVTSTVTTTVTATVPASPGSSPTEAPTGSVTPTPTPATPTASPTATTQPSPTEASATPTGPSAPVPAGFPDASSTGVPPGTVLSPYTGSCTITSTVTIDAKTLDCPGGVAVRAPGVVISNSEVHGRILVDTDKDHSWSLTLTDSEVDAGTGDLPAIYNGNVTIVRADIHGGHNGLECQEHSSSCSIRDSWIHDQWQAPSGDTHLGGILVLGNVVPCTGTNGACAEIIHNSVVCDPPVNASGGGCTGDINLLPHYGPLAGAVVERNLLGGNAGAAFCTYAGAGMEYPASHVVYKDNVFARGSNGRCAAYGPVTNFDPRAAGNVWSGNTWDDGTPLAPGNSQVP